MDVSDEIIELVIHQFNYFVAFLTFFVWFQIQPKNVAELPRRTVGLFVPICAACANSFKKAPLVGRACVTRIIRLTEEMNAAINYLSFSQKTWLST